MLQELFRIPGLNLPIYGYGLMLVIGFLAGAHLAKYLADRVGLNGEFFINAALLALVTGVLGARLSHILENTSEFFRSDRTAWENFQNMINLRSGGLTFYGGFLLAFPTLVLYAVWKKIPLRLGMDIIAPALMLGLAFGRIGCFLNGCCYGAECNLPIAVKFPYYSNAYLDQVHDGKLTPSPGLIEGYDSKGRVHVYSRAEVAASGDPQLVEAAKHEHSLAVHPAQLYSALNAFLIAAITYAYFTVPHLAGRGFALMLMLKGVSRFLLEMVRTEPAVLGPMSLSMVISLGLIALGIVLWVVFGKVNPKTAPVEAAPPGVAPLPA